MNFFLKALLTISFLMIPSVSTGCNFCSSKPKGLATDGPAQDPGSASQSPSGGGSGLSNGQTGGSRGSGSGSFTSDLKNYKPDGQRSNNEKWSSGDFFDNR